VPPTTKLRRSTRGRQMLRDMGESSGAVLGVGGLVGGVLLGGLLLYRDPVVGLSRHSLAPTPIVNVTALSQPDALTNSSGSAHRRRHAESQITQSLMHRVVVTGQIRGNSSKAL
jgi:hypothetical protein